MALPQKREFVFDDKLTEMLQVLKTKEPGSDEQRVKVREIIEHLNKKNKETPRG